MSRQSEIKFRIKKNTVCEKNKKFETPTKGIKLEIIDKTPSTALSELNIVSPTGNIKSSVSSARKALHSSNSLTLPGRENEILRLEEFILKHLNNRTSGSMYISGLPGTGKTASINLVINNKKIADGFKKVFLNCTAVKTASSIYSKICDELKIKISCKGKGDKIALMAINDYFLGKNKKILLILDEIDQLETKHQSVLYSIFEWTTLQNACIVLVGIANAVDLTDRTLPRICASLPDNLHPVFLHFKPYDREQIVAILKHRLAEAGESRLFAPDALELLSAKVAVQTGDIRRALDLAKRILDVLPADENVARKRSQRELFPSDNIPRMSPRKSTFDQRSPCKKDKENNLNSFNSPIKNCVSGSVTPRKRNLTDICPSPKKILALTPQKSESKIILRTSPKKKSDSPMVSAKSVLEVMRSVQSSSRKLYKDESVFTLHQKLLICTLLRIFKGNSKDTTIGKLHDNYSQICKKRGITPVDQSSFVGLCDQVEVTGAVKISKTAKNKPAKLSKIALQWDEGEIADAVKDATLLSTILSSY